MLTALSRAAIRAHIRALTLTTASRRHNDAGQATAEYALILLGAATIALLVVAWATGGGGGGKIGQLLNRVFDSVINKVK
jgi:Flp pilus assembly pilin Flp